MNATVVFREPHVTNASQLHRYTAPSNDASGVSCLEQPRGYDLFGQTVDVIPWELVFFSRPDLVSAYFSEDFVQYMRRLANEPGGVGQAARLSAQRLASLGNAVGSRIPDPQAMPIDDDGVSFAWRLGPELRVVVEVAADGLVEWFVRDNSTGETRFGECLADDPAPADLVDVMRAAQS